MPVARTASRLFWVGNKTCEASHFRKVQQGEFKQSSGVFEVGNKETEFPLTSK